MTAPTALKVCPNCGQTAPADARVCQLCLLNIRDVRPITGEAAEQQLARDHAAARERARLLIRRRWRVIVVSALALLVGALLAFDLPRASVAPGGERTVAATAGAAWSGAAGGTAGARATAASLAAGAAEAWTFEPGAAVTGLSADAERVYLALSSGRLVALDAATGAEVWTLTVPGQLEEPPAVDGDRLYINQRNSRVVALDPATGEQQWSVFLPQMGFLASSAVPHDGVLWVSAQNALYALDAEDGQVLAVDDFGARVNTAPVVARDGSRIAFGTSDEIRVVSTDSAKRTYHYPISQISHVLATDGLIVAVNPRLMVAAEQDARAHWWEGERTRRLWSDYWIRGLAPAVPLPRRAWLAELSAEPYTPAAGDGRIYLATHDGAVRSYRTVSGLPAWERTDVEARGAPVLTAAGVLVPVEGALVLLAVEDGSELQRWALPATPREVIVTEGGAFAVVADANGTQLGPRTLVALR